MSSLWEKLEDFKKRIEFVELSHPVSPETPHWAGFGSLESEEIYNFKKDAFTAIVYSMVSQYGTHIDAPGHFTEGGRMLDELDPRDALLPLVVVDVSEKVKEDPDYIVGPDDILEHERAHGDIPEGAFVALRTDWSKREENFDNIDEDGVSHYPGWSIPACRLLIEERGVKAIGHETSDTDASIISNEVGSLPVETYVLAQDIYQVELLRNLDKMPPTGGVIFVGYPNVVGAPGFSARCFGFYEKNGASSAGSR
ncbi:MAG: cyclase family protein [Peptoniphilus sp.]|nr:cyclase family protein [Peptoniphilus sp.]MDD7363038.1 cyclase family protein [Bacillota bacterium]MDY6045303.1 cyclase family protein [Peptoniphilus sp.]